MNGADAVAALGLGGTDGDQLMPNIQLSAVRARRVPWNKGRLIDLKRPLKPKLVWSIRARLELAHNLRDLVLLNLAIDSKLKGCDLVRLRVAEQIAI